MKTNHEHRPGNESFPAVSQRVVLDTIINNLIKADRLVETHIAK